MQIVKKLSIFLFLASLFLCSASWAVASPIISISSSGNGVFTLQGTGFTVVGGAKISIMYDTATLANPRVAPGGLMSGTHMITNPNAPGVILVAFINAQGVSGSGTLFTITFDLPGSSPGVIQSLTADLIDVNSQKIVSQVQINNPAGSSPSIAPATAETPTPAQGGGTAQTTGGGGSGTVPVLTGGTITMPGEGEPAKDKPREEPATGAALPHGESPAPPETRGGELAQIPGGTAAPAHGEKNGGQIVSYKSVLEQFRTFKGVKTPSALIAIFEQNVMQGIRQEPPIALSDGTANVKVFIKLPSTGKESPNFALKDAKLVSLETEGENGWMLELLPSKGVYMVTVIMLRDGVQTEIPLTVAPPAPPEAKLGKLTESDFSLFLKEQGTAKAPRFDLNGDGKRDYLDDYIFTANYLVRNGTGKSGRK
jgi:hypothetical protein